MTHTMNNIGVVGLGVMGANLALNMERNGFRVAGYDLDPSKAQAFLKGAAAGKRFELADSALAFIKQVKRDTPTRPIYFTHVVGKVAARYRFEKAYEGLETLYRVGDPLESPQASGARGN